MTNPKPPTRPTSARTPRTPDAQTAVPIAQMKPHHGAAVLFIDGKMTPPAFVDAMKNTTAEQFASCREAGISLYRLRDVGLGWYGAKTYDYSDLDKRASALLDADPQAKFLIEVVVDAPFWWCKAYPDECAAFCLAEPESVKSPSAPVQSWASRRWRTEAGEALGRLVRHISGAEWGTHCLGYQIACGTDGEWRHAYADRMPDTGICMTAEFRSYSLEKYRRNMGLLRKGWDDPKADFDRLKCPNAYERRYADLGAFRSSVRSRRILDYYECFYGAQNDAALHFCRTVRRTTAGSVLVGLAYATMFGGNGGAEDGHAYPEAVLDSDAVDFIAANGAADSASLPFLRALTGSIALRGKYLFYSAGAGVDPMFSAATALTHNGGFILPADTPRAALQGVARAAEQALRGPTSPGKRVSQVALIVDAAGMLTLSRSDTNTWLGKTLLTDQIVELSRLGAPCDVYLLSDLFHPKFRDNKVTIFLNTFYFSEAEQRRVDARVKRSGQTGVWLWAPGIISEDGIGAEMALKVTGQKIRVEKEETSMKTRVVEANDPLTWGFHVGSHFGTDKPVMPTLTVADKTATRLGANSNNKTVFSVRRFDQWTSIVYGALPVPSVLLRNVLRASGCHLYVDATGAEALVVADSRSLTVVSPKGGTIKLSLPGNHEITDILTGKKIVTGSDFEVKLKANVAAGFELRSLGKKREPAAEKNSSEQNPASSAPLVEE